MNYFGQIQLIYWKGSLAVEKVKEAVLGQNNANLKDLEHYSGDDSTALIRNLILPSP